MKYMTFWMLSLLLMFSCSDGGEKAETKEAQKVESHDASASTRYTQVLDGSYLEWRASHLGGVSKRFGKVQVPAAKAMAKDGKLTDAKAVVDLTTLTVENFEPGSEQTAKLTSHLKSGDFFDVEKYPTAQFELTAIESNTGEYNSKVSGNLTIKGVTKNISFPANISISDSTVSVDSAPFTVDRSNWGLNYHREGTAGVPVDYLISDEVGFTIHLKLGQ